MRENPWSAGLAALGVGSAIGLALSSTESQNELLGEARDAALDRAKGAARDAFKKVEDVASGVQELVTGSGS